MLNAFLLDNNTRIFNQYSKNLQQIRNIENTYTKLSDHELRLKATELKELAQKGEPVKNIINIAFALVCEATARVLKIRHYDVQIIGGLILNEGKIAEMKTGEGKTIVALLPTFLNALYGKGAHVVTVNDYLARRDAEYVGQVHKFLGLSVGLIQEKMSPEERRQNYQCDIVLRN